MDFFNEKTGFVGTVLSTRSVLWTSNMPKCVGGQGSAPDPAGKLNNAHPDPIVGWGTLPPQSPSSRRLRRSASVPPM